MKNSQRKSCNTGGFTLVEMLIVVAIIAVLIAVSIPLVSNSLEKSRDATDQANERSAKAEAVLVFLGAAEVYDGADNPVPVADLNLEELYYDAESGKLKSGFAGINSYGKCMQEHGGPDDAEVKFAGGAGPHAGDDGYLWVNISETDGTVTLNWISSPGGAGGAGGSTGGEGWGDGFHEWLAGEDSAFSKWYNDLKNSGDNVSNQLADSFPNLPESSVKTFSQLFNTYRENLEKTDKNNKKALNELKNNFLAEAEKLGVTRGWLQQYCNV